MSILSSSSYRVLVSARAGFFFSAWNLPERVVIVFCFFLVLSVCVCVCVCVCVLLTCVRYRTVVHLVSSVSLLLPPPHYPPTPITPPHYPPPHVHPVIELSSECSCYCGSRSWQMSRGRRRLRNAKPLLLLFVVVVVVVVAGGGGVVACRRSRSRSKSF